MSTPVNTQNAIDLMTENHHLRTENETYRQILVEARRALNEGTGLAKRISAAIARKEQAHAD